MSDRAISFNVAVAGAVLLTLAAIANANWSAESFETALTIWGLPLLLLGLFGLLFGSDGEKP